MARSRGPHVRGSDREYGMPVAHERRGFDGVEQCLPRAHMIELGETLKREYAVGASGPRNQVERRGVMIAGVEIDRVDEDVGVEGESQRS